MHVGVIASMKKGLELFIYREVRELAARGASISLYPTKHEPGLYNPPPDWKVYRWRVASVFLCQPLRWAAMPVRYLTVLLAAVRYRALVDFFLAAYFAPHMRDVDVIYATFGDRKLFVGYFCKRLLGKPLAVEIHAYELYQNPNPRLFPVALAACDQIIAATEYNRDILRDRWAIAPQQVQVVRYAVDLRDYRPENKFVVLIVAFFVEKKGHEILLQAVKKMARDDVEVWVVGGMGGSDSKVDVHALVNQLGMESQVAFFGKLSGTALKAVYHACDVFCLPSRTDSRGDREGFPNVLIEAMACGKALVVSNTGGAAEIITPGVDALVHAPGDASALAAGIEELVRDAALRRRIGDAGRATAERSFTRRRLIGELVPLYQALVGRRDYLPATNHTTVSNSQEQFTHK